MALIDITKKYFKRNIDQWVGWLVIASIITLSMGMPWPPNQEVKAGGETMILFWDGGAAPTDWTIISDGAEENFLNRYIRGNAAYGVAEGGAATHTHTATYVGEDNNDAGQAADNNNPAFDADPYSHTHGALLNTTVTSNNNLPSYRSLKVIQYDYGIASTIPSGAIAIFESTSAYGADWDTYTAQDTYFLRGGASVATGGDSNPTHNVSSGLDRAMDIPVPINLQASTGYGLGHGHDAGAAVATNGASIEPPYIEVIFAKTNTDVTSFPDGMIAGFNADPTGVDPTWDLRSDSGDDYYQKFLKANSSTTHPTTGGSSTHSHTNVTVTTGGMDVFSGDLDKAPARVTIAAPVHTHDVEISLEAGVDHTPLYWDLVLAEWSPSYTPNTSDWRWFDAEDTADPNTTNGGDTTEGHALADEETQPTNTRIVYKGNAIKLRIIIGEGVGAGGTDVKFKLQYDTTAEFLSATDVGTQASEAELWRYYNGGDGVDDDEAIVLVRLSGPPEAGRHNEDAEVGLGAGKGSDFSPSASTDYEHEFTIQNYNGAVNTVYYFQLQYMENSRADGGSWAPIALVGVEGCPNIKTSTANDLEVSAMPANVSLGSYTKGSGGTLQYVFQASEEIVFWDKRGTGVAYDTTVNSMSLVCADPADTIPGTDITWTSTAADPPDEAKALKGSFASDRTGFTGNDGETLDSTRNAYQAGTTTLPEQTRRGGFFFLPTIDLANLDSREVCSNYTGTLKITVI